MESFEAFIRRMEELLDRLEYLDDGDREDVYELLDAIDSLHRRGIETLVGALDPESLARVREDDLTAWLLEAYGMGSGTDTGSVPVRITRRGSS